MIYVIMIAAFLLLSIWLIKTAPEGYEDETGFQYGKDPKNNPGISTKK